jgi:hypothetical protein
VDSEKRRVRAAQLTAGQAAVASGAKTAPSKDKWKPLAHEILGLQKYIGPPDAGRVLDDTCQRCY